MDMNAPAIHYHGDQSNILLANEHEAKQNTLDIATAKIVAEALNQHYPGHLWAINVQGEQGVLTIHNLMLSGQWGYRLHMDKRYSVSELIHACKLAAGEILERYNQRRGRIDHDAMAAAPMDRVGRVIGELR